MSQPLLHEGVPWTWQAQYNLEHDGRKQLKSQALQETRHPLPLVALGHVFILFNMTQGFLFQATRTTCTQSVKTWQWADHLHNQHQG
jgi:hypothetical protein